MSKKNETTLSLEIGAVYYSKQEPHIGMEVVGIKKKHWYLVKFDGTSSRIRGISFTEEEDFFDNWFTTMNEAEKAHLVMLQEKAARFEEFINEKPTHLASC